MARQSTVAPSRHFRAALFCGTALQALAAATHAAAQPAPTARPMGGRVVAGGASIGQTTAQTTVSQSSQRAAINWQSFDVGSQHTVQFVQPNAQATTLNSVVGPDPSQIAGRIVANGNVIITNPAGVAFSRGAEVNVNSLIVSAPGITTENFMAGRLVFDQAPKPGATVSNAGSITVQQAGLAALVAPQVANSGVINARLGHVVLAGAEAHTIDLYGDGLVSIDVTKAVTQVPAGTALVTNSGTVLADGGSVQITARAADGIVQDLVRAGGTIRADRAGGRAGRVEIAGVGGSVRVEGRVAADGGGTVAVRATDTVTVASGATITADGRAGGGTVALGTTVARARAGRQAALGNGASPGTPAGTARQVVVEAGATVSADGTGSGNAGTVTALSTHLTRIDGLLSARGGAHGGDGGVIEASSDGVLMLTGAPNASAPAGHGGTIYLDPYDLVIGTGTPVATLGGSPDNPSVPTDGDVSGTSYISPATLTQAAQNGAVTITLNANHDLTVQEAVNLTQGQLSTGGASGGASLVLNAGHDLNVLANISIGAPGSGRTLTLTAGHDLFIGAPSGTPPVTLSADGTITLQTTGSLAGDPAAASITIYDHSSLTSNASLSFEASNRIGIGSNVQLVAQGDITLLAGSDIGLANQSTASAPGNLTLDAGGAVTVAAANLLSGASVAIFAASATEAGQNENAPAVNAAAAVAIGSSTISGAYTVSINSGTGGTQIAGTVAVVNDGTVQLSSQGPVTQSPAGVIVAADLSGTATSYDLEGTGNQILQIGANRGESLTATGGNISLVDSVPLTVGNSPSTGGGLQVPSGGVISLTTDQLTISAGVQFLPGGGGEGFQPEDEGSVPYALYAPNGAILIQPLTAGRAVELTAGPKSANTLSITNDELSNVLADRLQLGSSSAGTLTIAGTIGNPSLAQIDLISGGAILQPGGGQITVGTLTANGATVDLTGGANQIDTLGPSSASAGSFSLNNGTTPLTLVQTLAAATQINLTADSLAFCSCASVTAPTLQLTPYSPGRPIELVAETETSGRLSINQAMVDALNVQTLVLRGNAQGGVGIGNAGDAVDLTSHAATLQLLDPGAVTEGAGAGLRVGALFISGQASSITLDGPNRVDALTAQSDGAIIVSNAQPLRVDVASTPGTVRITTTDGDLTIARTSDTFDGTPNGVSGTGVTLAAAGDLRFEAGSHPENVVQATDSLSLSAGGAISQDAGTIETPVLTGTAVTVSLTQGGNQIANLGSFGSAGDFALADGVPLNVAGLVSAGTGGTLALAANNVQIGPGAMLSAPGGTVVIAPEGGGLTLTAAPGVGVVANTLRLGGAGDLALAGTFDLATVGTLDLESTGTVSEAATATLQVGTLTGHAATVSLTGHNQVGQLADFSVTGQPGGASFTLVDERALSIIGTLAAASGNVTITAANAVTVTGTGSVTAPAGTLTLNTNAGFVEVQGPLSAVDIVIDPSGIDLAADVTASNSLSLLAGLGPITQSAGAIDAPTLVLTGGSATLLGRNQIGTLASFSVSGALALADAGSLTLTGPGTAGDVTLTAAGSVTQSGGSLTLGRLSGFALGAARFGSNGAAAIGTLGAFTVGATAGSGFSLADAVPLTITGPLAAATISIAAPGSITLQGSQITADTASIGVSGGTATLLQTGTTSVAPFSVALGTLTLSLPGAGTMTLQQLSAPSIDVRLVLGSGTATGALDAAALRVSGSAGGATLTGQVAGQPGMPAAALATITPAVSPAYTLNGCVIGLAGCGIALPTALFSPRSFLPTELGNILVPDLLTVDLVTIGIVRNPADAELLLPNVSDQDY